MEDSCALLVLLAFVIGAGAQSLPTAAKLSRLTTLLEALALFLGKDDNEKPKDPGHKG